MPNPDFMEDPDPVAGLNISEPLIKWIRKMIEEHKGFRYQGVPVRFRRWTSFHSKNSRTFYTPAVMSDGYRYCISVRRDRFPKENE